MTSTANKAVNLTASADHVVLLLQCACLAARIILHSEPWVHIDLAGPVVRDERATGFGVPLLLEMFRP